MNVNFSEIKKIADSIMRAEDRRMKLAKFVKMIGRDIKMIEDVRERKLDSIRVCGVDGGIVKKSLHGFDFILIRAVSVIFSYIENKIASVSYFPSKNPNAKIFLLESLSEMEWNYSTNIIRQYVEIETAINCINNISPDVLLLDGSILPQYIDKPAKSSPLYENYIKLINLYKKLYDMCKEFNILLAGIVEDSRSFRFCELLNNEILSKIKHEEIEEVRKIMKRTRDTNLLFYVLKKGQRSITFNYSASDHRVIEDLGKYKNLIKSFYLKTAEFDRPIKVDFIGGEDVANEIAGIVLSISGHHSGYGIPTVLIEADNAAKLKESEIDYVYSHIVSCVGITPGIFRLRRDSRPF